MPSDFCLCYAQGMSDDWTVSMLTVYLLHKLDVNATIGSQQFDFSMSIFVLLKSSCYPGSYCKLCSFSPMLVK